MNLSPLSNVTTKATALSNLVLVTPQSTFGYQPQNPRNRSDDGESQSLPPAILFHYEGEQVVSLQSDITDHTVEDNTAIQDQIALRPEEITTHGFIGELNDVPPPLLAQAKQIAEKLTLLSAYTPQLTLTAQLAYNQAFFLYSIARNAVNAAVSAWNSISGGETQTKQQIYYQQFYGYWKNRTLFTVQTPWAIFEDMAIKSLRAIQDADSSVITDFEITFKKIRFAQTITSQVTIDSRNTQGRAASQAAQLINLGTSTPPQVDLGLMDALEGVVA